MVAVIEVSNTDELNELINLLYGDKEIIINNDYNKFNFVDLAKDNVDII